MDELVEIVGNVPVNGITIGLIISAIVASIFLYRTYNKFKNMIIENYKSSAERDKKINDTFEEVKQYKESQAQLTESIEKLHQSQEAMSRKLDELDNRTINYELSDTRDKLMQSYRYYTSPKHNPQMAWTELEYQAFFEMMRTYENSGGDGHMHTVVQPAMENLRVIPMSQTDDIAELMHTRN